MRLLASHIMVTLFSITLMLSLPVLGLDTDDLEELAISVAGEYARFIESSVNDTLMLASAASGGVQLEPVIQELSLKKGEIWYNLGSDENPIEQRKTIPIYRKISVIDNSGNIVIQHANGRTTKEKSAWKDSQEFPIGEDYDRAVSLGEGKVYVGKVMTWYTSKAEVFREQPGINGTYEKLIARDVMKSGVLRVIAPYFIEGRRVGFVVLCIDYRHLQEISKHIEPGRLKRTVSTRYAGNYLLIFDADGNTIVHPKPDNIRGYLRDGGLARLSGEISERNGSIFNFFLFNGSSAYRNIAQTVLFDRQPYISSATDVSGRTKLTVAAPILLDEALVQYGIPQVFGGVMLSLNIDNRADDQGLQLVKLKARDMALQAEQYLRSHPDYTIDDLKGSEEFQSIAVQKVGASGYTAVLDADTGEFYFHAQKRLVGTNVSQFKEKFPDFWKIVGEIIGTCKPQGGIYLWQEEDKTMTEKVMHLVCLDRKTSDGKRLLMAATAYIDESEGERVSKAYGISDHLEALTLRYNLLKTAAAMKSYAETHNESVDELLNDPAFRDIVLSPIGKTGYSSLADITTGELVIHPSRNLENQDLSRFRRENPQLYSFFTKSLSGIEHCAEYPWDLNGIQRLKYSCSKVIELKNRTFVLASTAYADELRTVKGKEVFAAKSIEAVAKGVAKQIEIYLISNPGKTLADLKEDAYFRQIAVQPVGDTGYTAVADTDTLVNHFHRNPKIEGMDLSSLQSSLPEFWKIMSASRGGKESKGIYEWLEPDGNMSQKFMVIAPVNVATKDGIRLNVAATTYLSEYFIDSRDELIAPIKDQRAPDFALYSITIAAVLICLLLLLLITEKSRQCTYVCTLRLFIIASLAFFVSYYAFQSVTAGWMSLYLVRFSFLSLILAVVVISLLFIRASGTVSILPNKASKAVFAVLFAILTLILIFSNAIIVGVQRNAAANWIVPGPYFAIASFLPAIVLALLTIYLSFSFYRGSASARPFILPSFIILIVCLLPTLMQISRKGQLPIVLVAAVLFCLLVVAWSLNRVGIIRHSKNAVSYMIFAGIVFIVSIFMLSTQISNRQLEETAMSWYTSQQQDHVNRTVAQLKIILSDQARELSVFAAQAGELSKDETKARLVRIYTRTSDYVYAVYRINSSGHIAQMYPVNLDSIGADISKQEHMMQIRSSMRPVLSSAFDAVEGFKAITIHYPVIHDGVYDGTVAVLINLDVLIKDVHNNPDHELLVFDNNDRVMLASDKAFVGVAKQELALIRPELVYSMGKNDFERFQHIVMFNEAGEEKLLIQDEFSFLDNKMEFYHISDTSAAFNDLRSRLHRSWIISLIVISFIILSGIASLRLLTSELTRQVDQRTEELRGALDELSAAKARLEMAMQLEIEANKKLKELDCAKSNFLNTVSHELKTPLTAMLAHIELLKDTDGLAKEYKSSIDAVLRNAKDLKMLIENILEISRIEAGKFELVFGEVEICQKIKSVVDNLGILAENKGLAVKIRCPKKLVIEADDMRVGEMLNNLISNAIKFTEKGTITVSAIKAGNMVEVKVEDTGIGIPENEMSKLFTKFHQVDPSLSRKYGGTGLGLSITKQLVELHGGTIKAKSLVGKGTSITFSLPMKRGGQS